MLLLVGYQALRAYQCVSILKTTMIRPKKPLLYHERRHSATPDDPKAPITCFGSQIGPSAFQPLNSFTNHVPLRLTLSFPHDLYSTFVFNMQALPCFMVSSITLGSVQLDYRLVKQISRKSGCTGVR